MLVIIPGSEHLQIQNFLIGCFLMSGDNLGTETKLRFGTLPKADGFKLGLSAFLQKVNYHGI